MAVLTELRLVDFRQESIGEPRVQSRFGIRVENIAARTIDVAEPESASAADKGMSGGRFFLHPPELRRALCGLPGGRSAVRAHGSGRRVPVCTPLGYSDTEAAGGTLFGCSFRLCAQEEIPSRETSENEYKYGCQEIFNDGAGFHIIVSDYWTGGTGRMCPPMARKKLRSRRP